MKCAMASVIIPITVPRDADIAGDALDYKAKHNFDSVRVRPTWGGFLLVGIKDGKEVWQ